MLTSLGISSPKCTTDASGDVAGVEDFPGTLTGANHYQYDANGNLTRDDYRALNLYYNSFNLPWEFDFGSNKKVTYIYDGAGQKIAKEASDGINPAVHADYLVPFVHGYTVGGTSSLKYIISPEGRLKNTGTNAAPVWAWEYNLTDHLGNVRVVFRPGTSNTDEVMEYNNYFPFGMKMTPYLCQTTTDNKYLYNGKELQTDFGLNWYDYGKRFYDPALARWHTSDPRAEKYFSWSPYNYGANNPILFIDPKGDTIIVNNQGYINRNDKTDNFVYMQGKNGKLTSIGELGKTINANTIYKNLLKANMKTANGIWSPFTFKNLVKNKGEWDLKSNMKTIYGLANHYKDGTTQFSFQGKRMEAQDIGNHHFGAVGKAYGFFPEKFMLQQAGAAQMASGTSKPEWQIYQNTTSTIVSPTGGVTNVTTREMLPPYGDDPRDQQWINAGFDYSNQQNEDE
jgi:RHS repeat-associated protein